MKSQPQGSYNPNNIFFIKNLEEKNILRYCMIFYVEKKITFANILVGGECRTLDLSLSKIRTVRSEWDCCALAHTGKNM